MHNLGVAKLKLGTIILPRSDSPEAISRLAEFGWFHKIESKNETITPEIDDLLLRAQKLHQTADDVIKGLGIPIRVGILEIMLKGTMIKKKGYDVNEIESIIDDTRKNMEKLMDDAKKHLCERDSIQHDLDDHIALKETTALAKKLDFDLDSLKSTKYFYSDLFIIEESSFGEISRSLPKVTFYKYNLDLKTHAAVIVIASIEDGDKVQRVMRGVNASAVSIPPEFPQTPNKAYALALSQIKELKARQTANAKKISAFAKKNRSEILTLHERCIVAKEILEHLRKPGGTKRFAVIRGYIPNKMEEQFKKICSKWTIITEEPDKKAQEPALLDNPRFIRTFETITDSQGAPKKGEIDPTPMIALMWPIFYGIMFADLGHGLLLMGMGLLFKLKGQGNLSRWGMLIAISGAAAAMAGVGTGEVFGFHLDHLTPFEELLHEGGALHSISWLVGSISVANLDFEQVINILKVSLFLGILHLLAAMILRVRRNLKEGHKLVAYTESIPNIVLYLSVIGIMMCTIGSSYDVINMYSRTHTESVPWVTVILGDWAQVWIVTRISIVLAIASIIIMIIGGIKHAKLHPDSGSDAISVVMETLLGKTIESLAHTVSYARIGIMLLVHAALLLTVNNAFESLGGVSSPSAIVMIIGGNIGIMMIEGLIVYIQSLRLHLYEYFTKWYDGGRPVFKQLMPETVYNKINWKK
ncbi:MAG: V-type ATPase subunit I [Cenarchaeum symbiont of Oopsacas minuta]|nr:V-type ATPase subunit I [Cenarchaeum symbiont of Oopsacas minuta]